MDQIPGDPSRVRDQATSMVRAAERMKSAAETLQRIDSGAYDSDAIDAVFVNTTEVASVLRGASTRYRGTGEALQDYAEVLDSAQQQSREASDKMAGTDVDGAIWDVASKQAAVANPVLLLPDREAERDQVHRELVQAKQELHAQQAQANDAREQWQRAKDDVDQAAEEAIRRIHIAVEDSGLNDAAWDDVLAWFDKAAVEVLAVLEDIGPILGIAALLTAWIPVVGQVFAALAGLAALVTLVATAYQYTRNDIGGKEALVTGAFAVLSIVPGFRAARTVLKIRQQGHVRAAIAKGVGRRAAKPSRIFYREEPGRALLPGVSRKLGLPVKGTYPAGMVPDAVSYKADEVFQDAVTNKAKQWDRQDTASGSVKCFATSSGGRG